MAESTVSIRVVTKGAEKLKRLDSGFKSVGKAAEKLNSTLDRKLQSAFNRTNSVAARLGATLQTKVVNGARAARNGFQRLAREAKKTDTSFNALSRTIAGLAIADRARASIESAAGREDAEARLTNLTQRYSQLIGIQDAATASSQKFVTSQTQTLNAYADLAGRLGSANVSLEDLQNIYEGLNTVLAVNRVSTQEAASAQLQLNQALGAGKLQGEEFRAIAEAAPQVLDAVAKQLGVSRGALKDLAKEGKITRQVLIAALTDIKNEGSDALAASLAGTRGKFKAFNQALEEVAVVIGEELLPVVTPLIVEATKLLRLFGKLPGPTKTVAVGLTAVATATALAVPLLKGLLAVILKINTALLANPWVAAAAGLTALGLAAYNGTRKVQEFNDVVAITGNTQAELDAELKQVQTELAKWQEEAEKGGRAGLKAKKKVDKLKESLEQIEGRRKIIIELQYEGAIKDFDKISDAGIQEALQLAGVAPPTPTETPSSSSGSERKSQLPELNAQLDSAKKLLAIDNQIAAAQLAGNKALENDLRLRRITLETESKIAQIMLEDIPAAEKLAKIAIAEVDASKQRLDLVTATAQAEKDRKAAIEDIARGIENENALMRARLNGLGEEEARRQRIAEYVRQGLDPERATTLVNENIALTKQMEQLDKINELYKEIGSSIQAGIVDGIMAAIEGGKEFQQILADTLRSIGKTLINAGVQGLGSQVAPKFFSQGGIAPAGTASIVGENGPEVIRPLAPTLVSPFEENRDSLANDLGQVSAEQAFAEASDAVAASASTMTSNTQAAQYEAAMASGPDNFTIESRVINRVEYVDYDQAVKLSRDAAKSARAQVYRDLKNKPGARAGVGI